MTGSGEERVTETIAIGIGGMSIGLRTQSGNFAEMLRERYAGFVEPEETAECHFSIDLTGRDALTWDDELEVRQQDGRWSIDRRDFRADWNRAKRCGWISQPATAYATDTVLRIVHTLLLGETGGFLLHAASAVRNGKAFLFSGESGAGKTTISRLAPADATLLTDEISYIRPAEDGRPGESGYRAFGTPFAGEIAKPGENVSAPVGALYFLAQGPSNRLDRMSNAEASRRLLRNILFFAEDAELVGQVVDAACKFVTAVPAFQLTFVPDATVWELIG
jgi:hypothetical protein